MTKGDIITAAFERARISGLTRTPGPREIGLALRRLEVMAGEWKYLGDSKFNFEDHPNPGSRHNLDIAFKSCFEANLALRILADFGKNPLPSLVTEANAALSSFASKVAVTTQVPYPSRHPIGSGNYNRSSRLRKYFPETELIQAESLLVGDITDYTEQYSAYLGLSEDLASYTITNASTSIAAVIAEALSSPDISYTVQAVSVGTTVVTITATTTFGRRLVRKITFNITED